jgi:Flp pilus assembly protein TadD
LGNFAEAIRSTLKALSLGPDTAELHFQLGLAYLAQGNVYAYRKEYREGVEKAKSLASGKAFTFLKDALEDS